MRSRRSKTKPKPCKKQLFSQYNIKMKTDIDKALVSFRHLLEIMDELREKCPWDKVQTFESLRTLTIEETYELADAIAKESPVAIKKELGDILLHIVFYAKIGSETGDFTMGKQFRRKGISIHG